MQLHNLFLLKFMFSNNACYILNIHTDVLHLKKSDFFLNELSKYLQPVYHR